MMRLFLCCAVLATAIFGVYSFPADLSEQDAPRIGNNPILKPQQNALEKPRPSFASSKPSLQLSDNLQQEPQSANAYIMEVAESTVFSEFPSAEVSHDAVPEDLSSPPAQVPAVPVYDPILETTNNFHDPEALLQDAIPETDDVAAMKPEVPSVFHTSSVPLAVAEVPVPETVLQSEIPAMDIQSETSDTKASTFSIGKTRRHAGVENPTSLRIGDFEDVEVAGLLPFTYKSATQYPIHQEQVETSPEISKEEMILMAMEQSHPNLPHMQLNGPRPSKSRPNLVHSPTVFGKPVSYQNFEEDEEAEDSSDEDQTVDLRNADEPATIVQEQPPVAPVVSKPSHISKGNGVSGSDHHTSSPYGSGSRNKPRPYGMDKPSKNRPTLDSKDKNEHFGLPHSSSNDYVHKGEGGFSSDSSSISYLGFQIPTIKWTSFSDLWGLPSFWAGQQNRQHDGLGKSDQAAEQSEACVDEEEPASEGIRSPTIQNNGMCTSSEMTSKCNSTCVSSGYGSGSCLGPFPTPGCLCRHPTKDIGLILRPSVEETLSPEGNRVQDLATSDNTPCKKCACIESCKQSGSYTGVCADRCYCAVPWSLKQL